MADKFEEAIDGYVEYKTTHEDAGGNYAHLPREGGWNYYGGPERLREWLEEVGIETTGPERESLVEMILDGFEYRPGHIYGGQSNEDEFTVESFGVGEVEDQYSIADLASLLEVEEDRARAFVVRAMDDRRFCLRDNWGDGVLSYTNTDSTWEFYVTKEAVLEWLGEIKEG